MKKYLIIAVVSFALVIVQLFVLRSLDYSKSFVYWMDVAPGDKMPAPNPDFEVGPFKWEVSRYEKAPELSTLRNFFREHCREKKGIKAASCVSLELIAMIPKGSPKREIFDRDYSPSKAFLKHSEGEQGYCTNYAGMASAMLLSVGVPARFLQIRPRDGVGGHNVIEVWDEKNGWVLFDPFNNGLIEKDGRYLSAVEGHFAENVSRVDAGDPSLSRGHLTEWFSKENHLQSDLVYPEPWLYTRVGKKDLPLLNGSFVGFGGRYFHFVFMPNMMRGGTLVASLVFAFAIIGLATRRFGTLSSAS